MSLIKIRPKHVKRRDAFLTLEIYDLITPTIDQKSSHRPDSWLLETGQKLIINLYWSNSR